MMQLLPTNHCWICDSASDKNTAWPRASIYPTERVLVPVTSHILPESFDLSGF